MSDDQHLQAFGRDGPHPIWFHENMTRKSVEIKLMTKPEGFFIIRDSGSSDAWALNCDYHRSVSEANGVRHYIVQRKGPTSFSLSDQLFTDLVELIAFYRVHLLDTACLTKPVPCEQALKNGVKVRHYFTTVRAKFNFSGGDAEDLSFQKGEILNVIQKHEPQWWKAQSTESLAIGVIPSNYVEEIADGPIAIQEKEAAAAAKKRAEMAALPKPPPPRVKSTPPPPLPVDREKEEREAREAAERQAAQARQAESDRIAADQREAEMRAAQEAQEAREREALQQQEEERARKERARLEQKAQSGYKPPERPKFVVCKATLDRQANTFDKSALTFREGDLLHVTKQHENGLWVGSIVDGRRHGRKGHFPFTFVEIMDTSAYDEDIKALNTEFQVKMLEEQGVDIKKLLKKGKEKDFERPPPTPLRAPTEESRPAPVLPPAAAGADAPPPIVPRGGGGGGGGGRAAPPLPASRGPAPPLPSTSGRGSSGGGFGKGAPPPAPAPAAGGGDVGDVVYGDPDEEEDIYGGTAELFDQSKIEQMMEEIYGTV